MSELNFTKLADAALLETVPDDAKAFAEVDGKVCRVAGGSLGGGIVDFKPAWYSWLGTGGVAPAGYSPKLYADESADITYEEFKKIMNSRTVRFRYDAGDVYGVGLPFESYCVMDIDLNDEYRFGYVYEWDSYFIFSDTDENLLANPSFPSIWEMEEATEPSAVALDAETVETKKKSRFAHPVPPRGEA